jgi:hypothetical protein
VSWGLARVSVSCGHPCCLLLQMDDEDTLLPRKLQAALEQALERKSELISQDSDSDSDDGEGRTFLL